MQLEHSAPPAPVETTREAVAERRERDADTPPAPAAESPRIEAPRSEPPAERPAPNPDYMPRLIGGNAPAERPQQTEEKKEEPRQSNPAETNEQS